MLQTIKTPIHKDGWVFIGVFLFVSALLSLASEFLGWVGLVMTVWCAYFFRNPDRVVPLSEGFVVSPADGVVCGINTCPLPAEIGATDGKEYTRISIFLNVFNVHVNRVPLGGTVVRSIYHPGKFFNASLDKASEHNERQTLVVETSDKVQVTFTQIAGLIARRIRCDVREGDGVLTGQRFGLIRFGSRMDVYLPKGVTSLVGMGQKMIAGETVLADLKSKEKDRQFEVR